MVTMQDFSDYSEVELIALISKAEKEISTIKKNLNDKQKYLSNLKEYLYPSEMIPLDESEVIQELRQMFAKLSKEEQEALVAELKQEIQECNKIDE